MGRRCWKAPDQGWGRRKGKGVGWLGVRCEGAGTQMEAGKVLCKEKLEARS